MDERQLLERLALIEALHSGAATPGEREAAAAARDRIRARLARTQAEDPPIEFSFKLRDLWSKRLLVALLRRYGIQPYRYSGQRYTTVMARVPRRFVREVLWPEFLEINDVLQKHLAEITDRIVGSALHSDSSDVEERSNPGALPESSEESAL